MMRAYWESRIGCLVASAGVVWAIHLATMNFTGMANVNIPRGPIETCGIGILIWLHAKWRTSVTIR